MYISIYIIHICIYVYMYTYMVCCITLQYNILYNITYYRYYYYYENVHGVRQMDSWWRNWPRERPSAGLSVHQRGVQSEGGAVGGG